MANIHYIICILSPLVDQWEMGRIWRVDYYYRVHMLKPSKIPHRTLNCLSHTYVTILKCHIMAIKTFVYDSTQMLHCNE